MHVVAEGEREHGGEERKRERERTQRIRQEEGGLRGPWAYGGRGNQRGGGAGERGAPTALFLSQK